jgi:hypothetical protein
MARENVLSGEERIANEPAQAGCSIPPRTVRICPGDLLGDPGATCAGRRSEESCKGILACDFFVAATATFRMLYVFVIIEPARAVWRTST